MLEHAFGPWFVVPGWVEGGVEVADLLLVEAVEACDAGVEFDLHLLGLVRGNGAVFDTDSGGPFGVPVIDSGEAASELDDALSPWVLRWCNGDGEGVENGEGDVRLNGAA